MTIKVDFYYETNFEKSPSPEDYLELGSPASPETVTGNPGRRASVPSPAYSPIETQASPRLPPKLLIPKSQHVTYGPLTPEQLPESHSKSPSYRGNGSPALRGAQGRKGLSPSDRFLCPLQMPEFPLRESENDERDMALLLRHFKDNLAIWVCTPSRLIVATC